uniref:Uncharacterized protein n=1 Tax=Knipowitschia caucasica TaxID=637954 RepID=A0AAV2MBU3_KNICA
MFLLGSGDEMTLVVSVGASESHYSHITPPLPSLSVCLFLCDGVSNTPAGGERESAGGRKERCGAQNFSTPTSIMPGKQLNV